MSNLTTRIISPEAAKIVSLGIYLHFNAITFYLPNGAEAGLPSAGLADGWHRFFYSA
jgi:hypothetical protein